MTSKQLEDVDARTKAKIEQAKKKELIEAKKAEEKAKRDARREARKKERDAERAEARDSDKEQDEEEYGDNEIDEESLEEEEKENEPPPWAERYFKRQGAALTQALLAAFKQHDVTAPPEKQIPRQAKKKNTPPPAPLSKRQRSAALAHDVSFNSEDPLDEIDDYEPDHGRWEDGDSSQWEDASSQEGEDPDAIFEEFVQAEREAEEDLAEQRGSYDFLLEDDEKVGEAIHAGLAKNLKRVFQAKSGETKLKAWVEKYPMPKNCEYLKVPEVNEGLWTGRNNHVKQQDVRFQRSQKIMVQGLIPLVQVMELTTSVEARQKLGDVFKMIVAAFQLVTKYRREAIMRLYPKRYSLLLDKTDPSPEYIFGDDLPAALKEVNQILALSSKMRGFRGRGGGYNSDRGNYGYRRGGFRGSRRPFLYQRGQRGRGRFQSNRSRGRGRGQSQ